MCSTPSTRSASSTWASSAVSPVDGTTAHVEITYTSLGCPCTELIQDDIRERLLRLDGVEQVEIEEVFEPWTRRDISATGLKVLRETGVG